MASTLRTTNRAIAPSAIAATRNDKTGLPLVLCRIPAAIDTPTTIAKSLRSE